MSYNARVLRILIASPSDVSDEREIAVNTIQAWNDLNSSERQIVLLPLRWETHSAPEYGRRPQEVINRQVVDQCDLLVGVFWTRIGSPTGTAESGTLEEIERVAKQGKPVMLYFSQAKQEPDKIDLEQLKCLREFKGKTFPNALVEHYSGQIDFRDKLSRQIEIQLRTLLAEENQAEGIAGSAKTDIQFNFGDVKTGKSIGAAIDVQTAIIHLADLEELPDFRSAPTTPNQPAKGILGNLFNDENKEYYRDMARYLVSQNLFRPLRFWFKNAGGIGARDIYIDIRISSEDSEFTVTPFLQSGPPEPRASASVAWNSFYFSSKEADIENLGGQTTIKLELPALQPQREVSPRATAMIGAKKSGTIEIEARIYADILSEPTLKRLQINWTAKSVQMKARDLLESAGISVPAI